MLEQGLSAIPTARRRGRDKLLKLERVPVRDISVTGDPIWLTSSRRRAVSVVEQSRIQNSP